MRYIYPFINQIYCIHSFISSTLITAKICLPFNLASQLSQLANTSVSTTECRLGKPKSVEYGNQCISMALNSRSKTATPTGTPGGTPTSISGPSHVLQCDAHCPLAFPDVSFFFCVCFYFLLGFCELLSICIWPNELHFVHLLLSAFLLN